MGGQSGAAPMDKKTTCPDNMLSEATAEEYKEQHKETLRILRIHVYSSKNYERESMKKTTQKIQSDKIIAWSGKCSSCSSDFILESVRVEYISYFITQVIVSKTVSLPVIERMSVPVGEEEANSIVDWPPIDFIVQILVPVLATEKMSVKSTEDLIRTIQVELKMLRLWSYQSGHQEDNLHHQQSCGAVTMTTTGYSTLDSLTVAMFQNYFGSGKLIQTLLLMAGIESNPGPRGQNNTPRNGSARQEADNIHVSIDSGVSTGTTCSRVTDVKCDAETAIHLRDDSSTEKEGASVVDRINEMQFEATRRKYKEDFRNYRLRIGTGDSEKMFELFDTYGNNMYVSRSSLLLKIQEKFLSTKSGRIYMAISPEVYDSVKQEIVSCTLEQAEKFQLQVFSIKGQAVSCNNASRQSSLYPELAENVISSLDDISESEVSTRNEMTRFIQYQLKYAKDCLLIFDGFLSVSEIKYLKKLLCQEELKQLKMVIISNSWTQKDISSCNLETALKITGSLPVNMAHMQTENVGNNVDETVQAVVLNLLINILSRQNFTKHDFLEKLRMNMTKVNIASLRNDDGLGLLHMVVFHQRVDFMEILFDVGLWEPLRNQRISGCNREYSGCDPFSLADKLRYNKVKETILHIDAWEKQMTVLQVAARQGDVKLVEDLINKYPHLVGIKTMKATMALYWACSAGSLETVRKLVSAGENPHDLTEDGENLLQRAVSLGHANLVKELTNVLRLPINETDSNGKYLFEIAAGHGDTQCFDQLMENQSTYENSALVIAAAAGKILFLKHLFSKYSMFVDINYVDKYSKTALFRAAEKGHSNILTFLLRKGANIKTHDRRRRNLFYIAAQEGNETIIDLLIKEAALRKERGLLIGLINHQDWFVGSELCFLVRGKDRGRQAWHYVEIQRNAYHIFKERTKGGAVDVADYGVALKSGWGREPPAAVVQEIDARYDERRITEATAIRDMTPLHIALLKSNFSVAKKLILNGADVNVVDKFRMTPLHIASMVGNVELVDLLISKNASLTAEDRSGKNAQDIAKFNQQTALVKHLTSSRYSTMVQKFLRESLDPLKDALGQEKLAEISAQGTDAKRYLIQTLRDLSTDINIFLFDIGSGPIQEESTATETPPNHSARPSTY